MDAEQQRFEDIERYLDAEMTAAESQDFEARCKEDAQLRQELELHREVAQAVLRSDEQELRRKLNEVYTDEFGSAAPKAENHSDTTSIANRLRPYLLAALLLISVGFITWQINTAADSPQAIFAEHFRPYPLLDYNRSLEPELESFPELEQKLGFALYRAGEYEQAAKLFRSLEPQSEQPESVKFYLAVSLLAAQYNSEAILNLTEIVQADAHYFHAPARWYLALAYVQAGQFAEAITALQTIVKTDDTRTVEAAKLLEELQLIVEPEN